MTIPLNKAAQCAGLFQSLVDDSLLLLQRRSKCFCFHDTTGCLKMLPLTRICFALFCPFFRGEGVDGVGPQQSGSGDSAGLRRSPATRHQVQLQRLGRAAPRHRIGLRAVPTGSGLQLQEVPSLQHQRSALCHTVLVYTGSCDILHHCIK